MFKDFLTGKLKCMACFALFYVIFFVTFVLFRLPIEIFLYPSSLCILAGLIVLTTEYFHNVEMRKKINLLYSEPSLSKDSFPKAQSGLEKEYQELLIRLSDLHRNEQAAEEAKYEAAAEYYSIWAHQIKTPIASMKLSLQSEDTKLSRKLSSELFRIEQYVEMALGIIRLNSNSTDYVIRKHDLDSIVRQCIKRFAGEFIDKKLHLEFTPTETKVLTDEKWLAFVIEQILSNALKYTEKGGIKIYLKEPCTLYIEDSGIGIEAEDLPRIFEKGYTGCNGRNDKRASGIGLYLCRLVCNNLNHSISAESVAGEGTIIKLDLQSRKFIC